MHRAFGTLPCPLRIGWGSAPIIDLWCSRWPALLPQSQEESITLWGLHQRTEGGDPDPRSNRTLHLKKKKQQNWCFGKYVISFCCVSAKRSCLCSRSAKTLPFNKHKACWFPGVRVRVVPDLRASTFRLLNPSFNFTHCAQSPSVFEKI